MKRIARPFTYAAAAFLAALSLASLSPAATETTEASSPKTAPKASPGAAVEARIKELHAKLKITPAQEDLWKNVTQVMRDNEKTMEALHRGRTEKAETMTAVDDVKSYAEIANAHAEGLKKFVSVFEALYTNMSDEQKKNADTVFSSHGRAAKKKAESKGN